MPKTRYGISPWLDAVPVKKRPEFPVFRGDITHPVVVVGGGMSGCMAAHACAAAGFKVILLDAGRIGQGGTGRATGLISSEASESFREVDARSGRRSARAMFDMTARAPKELAAMVKRLGIKAGLELRDGIRIVHPGASDKLLRREAMEREGAGLDAPWLNAAKVSRSTALESNGAMGLGDWGFVDPYRLALGFLSAARKRGTKVFERSAVRKITFNRKNATAVLDGGSITTENLIICVGEPTELFKALRRHLRREHRYAVLTEPLPATVRAELGERKLAICDSETPPHQLWFTPDHRVLFTGADQKRPPDRQQEQTLVQRTGQLMYELTRLYPAISGAAPNYGWEVPLAHPIDRVLYAGPHRNFPHQVFAFGTAHDPARAFLASRIILRCVLGKPDKEDTYFSFARNL